MASSPVEHILGKFLSLINYLLPRARNAFFKLSYICGGGTRAPTSTLSGLYLSRFFVRPAVVPVAGGASFATESLAEQCVSPNRLFTISVALYMQEVAIALFADEGKLISENLSNSAS